MNYNKRTYGSQAHASRVDQSRPQLRGASRKNTPSDSSLKSIGFGVLRGIWGILDESMPFLRYPLLMIVFGWFLWSGISSYLDMPEVHVSHTTKQCVRVITKDGPGDCSELPEKYHRVWVQ